EWVLAQEKIRSDEGSLSAIAQAAEGSLRDALSLLDQVIAACGEKLEESRVRKVLGIVPLRLLSEMVEAVHAADAARVLEQVSRIAAEGYELAYFCGELTRCVRNLVVVKSCGGESPLLQVPNDERKKLVELSGSFSEEDLARFFQILLRTEAEMRYSLEPRFHLELGLLKMVHARKLEPIEEVLSALRSKPAAEKGASGSSRGPSSAAAPGPAKLAPGGSPPPGLAPRAADTHSPGPAAPTLAMTAAPRPPKQDDERLAEIKSLLFDQSKKFLSSCLEHLSGWRFEDGEVRFLYAKKESWAADFLKSHEQLEALGSACAQVLGQPVKICVTLAELEGEKARARPTARERAERDAEVEAFRKTFDCTLVDVTDLSQE
ncbi:MAG: hypothetical protein DMG23_04360, partial [Acidobacteria bacterium]